MSATPKQVFTARIERIRLSWLAEPPYTPSPEELTVLQTLCTDYRMHEAWNLLATFSDDKFSWFVSEMLETVLGARLLPKLRELHTNRRAAIADACTVTEDFIETCECSPVFATPLQMILGGNDDHATIGDCFPDLLARAREALLALQAELANAAENELDDVGDMGRKFGDGRAIIARDLVWLTKEITGQPHFEAVASLLRAILGDDDLSADAVRKAVSRRPDYSLY